MKFSTIKLLLLPILLFVAISAGAQTMTSPSTNDQASKLTAQAAQAAQDDRYRIGFQDVLDVQVFKHPELAKRVVVGPNGTIELFQYDKQILAVCKTDRELSNDIAAAYKEKLLKNPQVSVIVTEQKSQSLAVIGAVERPGSFFVSRRVNLLQLLAMAGGPNKESGTRLIVARSGSTSNCKTGDSDVKPTDDVALFSYRVRDVQEGKKNPWMEPGDVVSVLDADVVYVYGNVTRPGEIHVREPITLRQAIAASQGLKTASAQDKVRVLRQIPDSIERKELTFNLVDIEKRKVADPYLEPNDIVAVSVDSMKSILISIGNTVRSGIPTVITRVPIP
jgi:polysaccharide export outer membrane protein